MTTWNTGNFFRDTVSLTEGSVINGGNWILAEITTNGNQLTLNGGNLRGLHVDGDKDLLNWPGNVTTNVTLSPGHATYVWQRLEPLQKAADIIAEAEGDVSTLYLAALEQAFTIILTGSGSLLKSTFLTDLDTWLAANDSPFDAARFGQWILDYINAGWTWAQVRDYIQSYSANTWKGVATQVEESYS